MDSHSYLQMSRAVIAISKCIVMGFHSISVSEHVAAYKGKKVFSGKKHMCCCSRSKQMHQTDQMNKFIQQRRNYFWVTIWYKYIFNVHIFRLILLIKKFKWTHVNSVMSVCKQNKPWNLKWQKTIFWIDLLSES